MVPVDRGFPLFAPICAARALLQCSAAVRYDSSNENEQLVGRTAPTCDAQLSAETNNNQNRKILSEFLLETNLSQVSFLTISFDRLRSYISREGKVERSC